MVPRVCQPRDVYCLLLGLALLSGQVRSECERRIPDCVGETCVEKVECLNGRCGDDGACDCLPCYSGPVCASYDDKYDPRFAIREDTVIINAKHEGVVYKASAEDEDLGLTCPLGPGHHTRCPCAAITYSLLPHPDSPSHPLFTIHDSSGQVFLREGARLTPGSRHHLEIIASSTNNSLRHDYQKLTVLVHREDHLYDLLQEGSDIKLLDKDTENWKADGFNSSQFHFSTDYSLEDGHGSEGSESLDRRKRFAVAADNEYSSLDINVTRLTALPADDIVKPGITLEYETTIMLPEISTAMQLLVEVFAMDPVSGNTAFALCGLEVTSIGSKIQTDSGAPLTTDKITVTMMKSDDFAHVNHRAYVDFGKILNTDTYTPGETDFTDSTITIKFSATLIINPSYSNTSALVTVGAQYDDDNYIFVGTDKMSYTMTPSTYAPDVSLDAPSSIAQYGGATFLLDTYINHPFEDLLLQVYTPNVMSYDKFSISNIGVSILGANLGCSGPGKVTYYPSVTGLTNSMAEYSISLITQNMVYPLPNVAHHGNQDYHMQFFFNVFALNAEAGSTVDVSVGLVIGSFVRVENATLSVTAGAIEEPTPSGSASWGSLTAVTPTNVEVGQAVTWASTLTLSSSANIKVTCTLTVSSGNKVCGIAYGKVGANIANLPDLSRHLVFGTDSVTFTLFFNSTGKATDSGADDVEFEFSVTVDTSQADVTITCLEGLSETPSATSITASGTTSDLWAWVDLLTPQDNIWYEGSQIGLLMKLSFPAGGTPYSNLLVEAVGNVDETTWGARTCGARVVSVGKAVPCLAGGQFGINTAVEQTDALLGRPFTDTTKMTLGHACGTQRTSDDADREVAIELYFDMPSGQSGFAAGTYNLSLGVNLDNNIIWTGWEVTDLTAGAPSYDANAVLHFGFLTDSVPATDMEPGVPHLIQVLLRTKPESVMHYKITAEVDNTAILSLCRIVILEVGNNFPCVDQEPYDKEDELYQITKITHDAEWGLSAVLDLGVIRNLGNNTFVAGGIPDENSIVVGVVLKGVAQGSGTLTVTLDSSGTTSPISQALTVGAAVTPNNQLISITAEGKNGTPDAFEDVMKMVDFVVQVPEGYKNTLKATITYNIVTHISVCFGAVVAVGKNLPCVIPSQIIGSKTVTPTSEEYVVDLKEVCHYPATENQTESQFTLRVGVMLLAGSDSAPELSLVMRENDIDLDPTTFSFTKLTTEFSPDVNETGMQVELLSGVDIVKPGMQFWTGVILTVPRDIITTAEFAVTTTSDGGRAYATVHDFRIPQEGVGKNLGCFLSDLSLYSRVLTQNSSHVTPMIHESQTDTLVVDLKSITNMGLTYIHKVEQPVDDQVQLEALITIADHPNATDGATIYVHFGVKTGNAIYVVEKSLTLDRTATPDLKTTSELLLTDNTTTIFSQGDTVPLTLRVRHLLNESTQEVNDACVRVFMPKYLKYVESDDTFFGNVTGNLTFQGYLDYCFDYLFFTDNLEANFTLSVDPDKEIPAGMEQVKATTLLRLLGTTTTDSTLKYIGKTAYVVYEVKVNEVIVSLELSTMEACQFTALAAIDATTKPEMAKPESGGGWSPPVTVGMSWKHYITVDFLKRTRVARITFEEVTGKLSIKTFRLQYSQSGIYFSGDCQMQVPSTGVVDLPRTCRFEARFFRVVVVTVSDGLGGTEISQPDNKALGVRFTDWYGADMGGEPASCTTINLKTRLSDDPAQWRHVAYDTTNNVFYFCDVTVKSEVKGSEMACFSSSDGNVWAALPSYIGRLVGHDPNRGMMCAEDKRGKAVVCSKDGKQFSIMQNADHADILANAETPNVIPGLPSGQVSPITLGSWKADFTGVSKDGNYRAKWANCCS